MRYVILVGFLIIFTMGLMLGYSTGLKSGREDGYMEACQDAANGKLKMTAVTKWEWKNAADKR